VLGVSGRNRRAKMSSKVLAQPLSEPPDRAGGLVDDIAAENLIWSPDYPHTDGIWPASSKYIEQ
jgi:hypothetical protein